MPPTILLFILAAIVLWTYRRFQRPRVPLPPGPPPAPIVGNLRDLRVAPIWLHRTKLAKQYGR